MFGYKLYYIVSGLGIIVSPRVALDMHCIVKVKCLGSLPMKTDRNFDGELALTGKVSEKCFSTEIR